MHWIHASMLAWSAALPVMALISPDFHLSSCACELHHKIYPLPSSDPREFLRGRSLKPAWYCRYLTRAYGLTVDNILSATIIIADGSTVRLVVRALSPSAVAP